MSAKKTTTKKPRARKTSEFTWKGFQAGDILKVMEDGSLSGFRREGETWTHYPLSGRKKTPETVTQDNALHAICTGRWLTQG